MRETHAYGPSAMQALCGARAVYSSVYAREVTCAACRDATRRARPGEAPAALKRGGRR